MAIRGIDLTSWEKENVGGNRNDEGAENRINPYRQHFCNDISMRQKLYTQKVSTLYNIPQQRNTVFGPRHRFVHNTSRR